MFAQVENPPIKCSQTTCFCLYNVKYGDAGEWQEECENINLYYDLTHQILVKLAGNTKYIIMHGSTQTQRVYVYSLISDVALAGSQADFEKYIYW